MNNNQFDLTNYIAPTVEGIFKLTLQVFILCICLAIFMMPVFIIFATIDLMRPIEQRKGPFVCASRTAYTYGIAYMGWFLLLVLAVSAHNPENIELLLGVASVIFFWPIGLLYFVGLNYTSLAVTLCLIALMAGIVMLMMLNGRSGPRWN